MRSRNIIFVFSAFFAVSAVDEIMLVAESERETQTIEDRRRRTEDGREETEYSRPETGDRATTIREWAECRIAVRNKQYDIQYRKYEIVRTILLRRARELCP